MKKLLNSKLIKQIFKFGIVGGSAFLIDYSLLYILTEFCNIHYLTSSTISFIVSLIFNYILSIKWVFDVNKKQTIKDITLFIILSIIGLGINQIIMYLMSDTMKIYYMISKIVATAIVMVWNFVTRKIFIERNYNIFVNFKKFYYKNEKIIKFIVNIILSYFVSCSIFLYFNLSTYNIIYFIIFAILFIYFSNINIHKDKKFNIVETLLSFIFPTIMIVGKYIAIYQYDREVSVFREILNLDNLIIFIGLFLIFFSMLNYFFSKLKNVNVCNNKQKWSTKKIFVISFLIIFVCWIFYFLNYFPASMTPDSISQFRQILGFKNLSNHHPIFHTMFMSLFYNLGRLFLSKNAALSCVTISQMIIMASIFSFLIKELYKRNLNKLVLFIILLYFAINPINAYYSITLWKDILFSGIFLLFSILLYVFYEKESHLKFRNFLILALVILIMLLLRNNAIYILLFSIPFILITFKKTRMKLFIILVSTIGIYFIIQGPIFNCFNISKSSSAESIGMPLQQIGRMTYKDINFTDDEKELINNMLSIDIMREVYNPTTSDNIKFNDNFNINVFDNNKLEYFKLWIQLCTKYPGTAFEAYLNSTLGYWYPNIHYWVVSVGISESELNFSRNSITDIKFISEAETISRNLPIINLHYSIGFNFWLILIGIALTYLLREKKYLCFYIPVIGLWLTLMIAAPVFAEFRYIYGAFVSVPFLLLIPFLNNKTK